MALARKDDAVLDIAATCGADGRSRLERRRVSYPWSLGRGYPSSDHAGAITIIPQVAGAGLLAGDEFSQAIGVGHAAALRVVSAGATLVHGASPPRTSRSSWRYVLEGSARASIASEPYVLMEDADLALHQVLVVDEDAMLVAAEALVLAHGVSRASWRFETSVFRPDGTRIFGDNQVAAIRELGRIGRLPGGVTAFATVLVLAPPTRLEGLSQEFRTRMGRAGSPVWGACAPLRAGAGVGIRIAAHDGGHIRSIVRELHELAEDSIGL